MSVTITLGLWVIPMAIGVIGTLLSLWRGSASYQPSSYFPDFFTPVPTMVFVALSWAVPWGLYGVLRAVFG